MPEDYVLPPETKRALDAADRQFEKARSQNVFIGEGDSLEEANRMAEDLAGGRPIKDSDLDPETITRRGKLIAQLQKRFPAGNLVPITEREAGKLAEAGMPLEAGKPMTAEQQQKLGVEAKVTAMEMLLGAAEIGVDPGALEGDQTAEVLLEPPPRSDSFNEPLLQLFKYEHLPPHLQAISAPFCNLARQVVATLPRNPERTVALRKLREAKDAAVTASLWKEVG